MPAHSSTLFVIRRWFKILQGARARASCSVRVHEDSTTDVRPYSSSDRFGYRYHFGPVPYLFVSS
eukprot:scaffold80105_cov39-Tisochrysis_lutea.AAC.1